MPPYIIITLIFFIDFENHSEVDSRDVTVHAFGLAISFLSILYGLSTYNLRNILKTEPGVKETLLFTLTEFSTSVMIFLTIPGAYTVTRKLVDANGFVKGTIFILLCGIQIIVAYQLSYRFLKLKAGCISIDYRINFSVKCQELQSSEVPSVEDKRRSRRDLVIINLIYGLATTSAVTFAFCYLPKTPLCIILSWTCTYKPDREEFVLLTLTLVWYASCILSLLQNTIELLLILIKKKSFLDWTFLSEQVERLEKEKNNQSISILNFDVLSVHPLMF